MKIIFPYIDKKTNKTKTMLYLKKKKKNIYKIQQLDFYAQIC